MWFENVDVISRCLVPREPSFSSRKKASGEPIITIIAILRDRREKLWDRDYWGALSSHISSFRFGWIDRRSAIPTSKGISRRARWTILARRSQLSCDIRFRRKEANSREFTKGNYYFSAHPSAIFLSPFLSRLLTVCWCFAVICWPV